MLPLNFASPGEELIVRRISGKPEVKKHLENLGFTPGSCITVISSVGGDLIVKVKESRIAVNQDLAGKIMV